MKALVVVSIALALAGEVHADQEHRQPMDHEGHMAEMADAPRHTEVAQRGGLVMPFDLKATTHIFTQNAEGGRQDVVAKALTDEAQVGMVRQHLKNIQAQFSNGNFSGPTYIHGMDMPGLTELKAAKPGQIAIDYQEIKGGARLVYRTQAPALVAALHRWFDAQVSDHGADAVAGHMHHHGAGKGQ